MTSFRGIGGIDVVAMNENGKKRPIRAGKAFMAAVADDPQAQQSLAKASLRLRAFAAGIKQLGVTHHQVVETIGRVFAAFNDTLGEVQRAIDSFETNREDRNKFEDAMKRLRKAISKLRRALHDNKADDHLLIVRGGSAACPEYTMVLRFQEKR